MAGETILYFDGVCGLCNRFVDWLVPRNVDRRLRFAALQGAAAAERLPPAYVAGVATVVLERNGHLSDRSTAVLEAVALLGGRWRAVAVLKAVPRWLRDPIYDWVARHRLVWFGRMAACRVPSEADRAMFLP